MTIEWSYFKHPRNTQKINKKTHKHPSSKHVTPRENLHTNKKTNMNEDVSPIKNMVIF